MSIAAASQDTAGERAWRACVAHAQELGKERPSMKLLYVTPEQLVASAQLEAALRSLQQRRLLARFVVDEAR